MSVPLPQLEAPASSRPLAHTGLFFANPALAERAAPFVLADVLSADALALVDTVAGRFGEVDPEVLLGLALVVEAQGRGHVGLSLRRAHEVLAPRERTPTRATTDDTDDTDDTGDSEPAGDGLAEDAIAELLPWPVDGAAWERAVVASPLVGAFEEAGRPFASQELPGGEVLVMSRRMAWEQRRLADGLIALARATPEPAVDESTLEAAIARLYPEKEAASEGAQAVRRAAARSLSVVTGGPGTGKTYSIKRLLAVLYEAEDAADGGAARPLRVVLAAPTGKAAVRMTEAIAEELDQLETTAAVRAKLGALPSATVHRLLRIRPDGSARYGAKLRLPYDVVVVDEASMLDLAMMRKLVEAVAPGARLVLLGDRDQLASVEAGTVLADVVSGHFEGLTGPLEGTISRLTTSHRFESAPTVAEVAKAIQERTPERLAQAVAWMTGAVKVPKETDPQRVQWLTPDLPRAGPPPELGPEEKGSERERHREPEPLRGRPSPELLDQLTAPYLSAEGYAGSLGARLGTGGVGAARRERGELLDALGRYRVLAAHRRGPRGVSGLLRELARRVRAHLTSAWNDRYASTPYPVRAGHWLGEPILVTQNAYDVDLRNGDVGLVLPSEEDGKLVAVFPVGGPGLTDVREVALSRLPPHMGALAMTIHKSQGSQFAHVAVVLTDRASPIQTRELVYTAVTRASARLTWVGTESTLTSSLSRPVARTSGLAPLLWRGGPERARPQPRSRA